MQSEGYHILKVSHENQLRYGCNCLNLGAGRVIAVNEETARDIVQFEHFNGHVQYIDFSAITSMYGAVHCASQVVVRTPLPNPNSTDPGDIEGSRRGEPFELSARTNGKKRPRATAIQGV
jgi:Arginine deiminase